MGKIYRHVERKRNISRKGSFPRSVYYGKIKSDGFALPGDPSVTLGMTDARVIMNTVKFLGRSWQSRKRILRLSLRGSNATVAIPKIGVRAIICVILSLWRLARVGGGEAVG